MTDAGTPDQVHPERLREQDADRALQSDDEDAADEHDAGRGGALHRLGTGDDDAAA